jgi:uncharacterized protein YbjT (DUF2867 family)
VIAVVGATGWVGSALVERLAREGRPVRALTRRPERWTGPPVEVVGADADGSLEGAFDGAHAAFLMSAQRIAPGGRPSRLERLVSAATTAGVGHLVLLSVFGGPDGDDPIGRWNAATEAAVIGSGVPWTLLRPGRFFSNAAHWARSVRGGETVPLGFARRTAAGIDPADVAAVAAAALADRSSFSGTALRLTGPESLAPRDELAILGEVLGRRLPAREMADDEVRHAMARSGETPEVVDAVVARTRAGGEGADPLPTVADLLGRGPRRFADWAHDHAALFA